MFIRVLLIVEIFEIIDQLFIFIYNYFITFLILMHSIRFIIAKKHILYKHTTPSVFKISQNIILFAYINKYIFSQMAQLFHHFLFLNIIKSLFVFRDVFIIILYYIPNKILRENKSVSKEKYVHGVIKEYDKNKIRPVHTFS